MKSQAKLKVVTTTHRPVVDLYGPWRAEIESRNWAKVHEDGDKSKPVDRWDRPKGFWRG